MLSLLVLRQLVGVSQAEKAALVVIEGEAAFDATTFAANKSYLIHYSKSPNRKRSNYKI